MLYIIISAAVFLLDRAVKLLVMNYGTYTINTGTLFGLFGFFKGSNIIFLLTTLVIILIFIFLFHKKKILAEVESGVNGGNKLITFSAALITGGAFGNIFDRVFYGGVIDYIDLGFWPSFNIADASLVCGMAILMVYAIKKK
ncbi:signal peptidase II [Candidatus Woesearchaeota archaeon]|nr:signal peptidase II [Candidatus Woesearchaeota archaeon]